jgi:hypothetical protein
MEPGKRGAANRACGFAAAVASGMTGGALLTRQKQSIFRADFPLIAAGKPPARSRRQV